MFTKHFEDLRIRFNASFSSSRPSFSSAPPLTRESNLKRLNSLADDWNDLKVDSK